MSKLTATQLKLLREAMIALFPGQQGLDDMYVFFGDLDMPLTDYATPTAVPRVQLQEALAKLNNPEKIGRILDELEHSYRDETNLQNVIAELRPSLGPTSGSDAAIRFRKLEAEGLLLDGLAFINRSRLRGILFEVCSPSSTARVALITGASLCGKSWSHHLIRSHCRTAGMAKLILLDMQQIQPGNDPRIVWTELLRRLIPARRPPEPPAEDTKRGQYATRLVDEICIQWEAWEDPKHDEKPWPLLVVDHLEKNAAAAVGPAVVDFAEALAVAATARRFDGARVLLLGFPRAFVNAAEMGAEAIAPRETVESLTDAEINRYLSEVAQAIGRGPPEIIGQEATRLLADADRAADRRAAMTVMSSQLGAHVAALARAAP